MNVLQWIIIGALVYAIYYVINKYEKRVNELMRLIELNREDIDKNKESIKKNSEAVSKNAENIAQNKERLDQQTPEALKNSN